MEDFGIGVTSAAEVHRTEFNSAYATLEQAIRNFSKEKLIYEQTINGLQDQIGLAQQSVQKLSMEYQDGVAENKRLVILHEENEKNRFELEALTSAVERKQEIISDIVAGLEKAAQEVFSRYEEHEEFIYCLKYKQVLIKKWIDDCLKQIDALQLGLSAQQEELTLTRQKANEQKKQFEEEKLGMEQKVTEIKIQMNKTLEACNEQKKQYEEERLNWEQEVENMKKSFTETVNVNKNEFVQKIDDQKKQFEEEKMSLEHEIEKMKTSFNESIEACNKRFLQEAEDQKRQFEQEKNTILQETENMKKSFTESMEACNMRFMQEAEEQKKQFEEEKIVLQQEAEKMKISFSESMEASNKQFLQKTEEQKKQFDDEKIALEHEIEKTKIAFNESMEASNTQFMLKIEEQKKQFVDEKSVLENEIEKMKISFKETMEASNKEYLKKTEDQKRQYEEERLNLEREIENIKASFNDAKEVSNKEFMEKMDDQKKQSEMEKIAFQKQAEEMKTSFTESMEACNKRFLQETEEQKKQFDEEKMALQQEAEKMKISYDESIEDCRKEFLQEAEVQKKQFEDERIRWEQEIDTIKSEKRELQKRYQDQKQAIAKMVEEVGVRPVILPSARSSSLSRTRVPTSVTTPISSQEKSRSDAARQVPKTPLVTRPLPDPTTPTRTGILKGHNFGAGDKSSRNVSFGPTFVADFAIASDTDESNTSDVQDAAFKNEALNRKRIKLSDESKLPANTDGKAANETVKEVGKESKSGKQLSSRRYLKRGIAQPKRSYLVDALQFEV